MSDVLKIVGQELREAREALGLPQQAIAKLFGEGRDSISKLERGEYEIPLTKYLEIVRYLEETLPNDHPAIALANRYYTRPGTRA
jgi:transcriptional regulator with XRE-family HTH domain